MAQKGKLIFQTHCALCHDDSEHMLNDNGPALFGVVGRRVGSVPGYDYSEALRDAACTATAGRKSASTSCCKNRPASMAVQACR
jgi:cytochrome c2